MVKAKPLSEFVGSEIEGRVQDHIGGEAGKEIYRLFLERGLLVFRNQDLPPEDQVAFCKQFGPVSHRGLNMKKGVDIAHVSNNRPDGVLGFGEMHFHADHCFYQWPLKSLSLYAIEVPPTGGDTLFAHAGAAYDRLPEATKRRIEKLEGLHLYDFSGNGVANYSGNYNGRFTEEAVNPETSVRWRHPLVWAHPETGRKIIFVNKTSTARIYDVSHEEGEALLDELAGYVSDPAYVYRHQWRVGDLLVWDNRILQHARTDFDGTAPRTMRRVPIAENCPAAASAAA